MQLIVFRPRIPFGQLLSSSLVLVAPTVLALDALVFFRDLDVDFAIWVVAGAMVSSILVAWMFLGDMADMATLAGRVAGGDLENVPEIRSGPLRRLAHSVVQMNHRWRRQADYFSRSITADMAILETLHDPLIFIGADRRVVRANAAARSLFGGDLTGQSVETALKLPELFQAVLRNLKTRVEITISLEWPGTVTRYFDVRALPIEAPGVEETFMGAEPAGAEFSTVLTLHEVTELRRAVALRERFIADVSHELRTPLSSIIGFIETIEGPAKNDPEAQGRFLQIMHDQANRMARIVADLLSLSRTEQRETEPLVDLVDMAELLHEVATGLDIKAMRRGMVIDVSGGDLPPVRGDRDQLFQVFQNLIDNAIKYGRVETTIEVSAGMANGNVFVSVTDSGEGIAPEHLPHLGERFYRADSGRSRQTGGSGLGLSIVQTIVRHHAGALRVESKVGSGSVFTVELPGMGERGAP